MIASSGVAIVSWAFASVLRRISNSQLIIFSGNSRCSNGATAGSGGTAVGGYVLLLLKNHVVFAPVIRFIVIVPV